MPDPLSATSLQGRRILVVEDEYMMAEDLRRDLEKAPFSYSGGSGQAL
jgi:hypothetical protein